MAREKGFKGTKSLFWFAIRNPVYCGKISIPKYKEEEAGLVKGSHKPIISEDLFYRVQDALDGRKRNSYRLKVVSNASLPLRGFLICPKCGKLLTGSASKGHTKYYAYYHCFDGCATRFRADVINGRLVEDLRKYIPRQEMSEIYKIKLSESWYTKTNLLEDDRKSLLRQIKEQEARISYIRELLSTQQLDPIDFREMKTEYTGKLEKLEARLAIRDHCQDDIPGLLDVGINNLLKLDYIYGEGEIERKRIVISSMYPEKLTFDGDRLRTNRVNEAARIIYTLDQGLGQNKKGQSGNISTLSSQVGKTGFELACKQLIINQL